MFTPRSNGAASPFSIDEKARDSKHEVLDDKFRDEMKAQLPPARGNFLAKTTSEVSAAAFDQKVVALKLAEDFNQLPPTTNPHYQKRLDNLKKILDEVAARKTALGLTQNAFNDFLIVINTLEYIIRDIAAISARLAEDIAPFGDKVFLPGTEIPAYAVIHLKDLPKDPVECERQLIEATVDWFVSSYNIIKERENKPENKNANLMRRFISKLNGICIDARIRSAFRFVENSKLSIVESINEAIEQHNWVGRLGYFQAFAFLLLHSWGNAYSEPALDASEASKVSFIGRATLQLIKTRLHELGLKPDATLFLADEMPPQEKYFDFLQFVLLHPDYLNSIGVPANEHESVEVDVGNQQLFASILSQYDYLSHVEENDLEIILQLYQRLHLLAAEDFFEHVQFGQTPFEQKKYLNIFSLFIKKIFNSRLTHQALVEKFLATSYEFFGKNQTLLHIAVLCNLSEEIKILVSLGASLWWKNEEGETPLDLCVPPLVKLETVESILNLKKIKKIRDEKASDMVEQRFRAVMQDKAFALYAKKLLKESVIQEEKALHIIQQMLYDESEEKIPQEILTTIELPLIGISQKNIDGAKVLAKFLQNTPPEKREEILNLCLGQCETDEIEKAFAEEFLEQAIKINFSHQQFLIIERMLSLVPGVSKKYHDALSLQKRGFAKMRRLFDDKAIQAEKEQPVIAAILDPEITPENFRDVMNFKEIDVDNVAWKEELLVVHVYRLPQSVKRDIFLLELDVNLEPIEKDLHEAKKDKQEPQIILKLLTDKLKEEKTHDLDVKMSKFYRKQPILMVEWLRDINDLELSYDQVVSLKLGLFKCFARAVRDKHVDFLELMATTPIYSRFLCDHVDSVSNQTLLEILIQNEDLQESVLPFLNNVIQVTPPERIMGQQNDFGIMVMRAAVHQRLYKVVSFLANYIGTINNEALKRDCEQALLDLLEIPRVDEIFLEIIQKLLGENSSLNPFCTNEKEEDALCIAVRNQFFEGARLIKSLQEEVKDDVCAQYRKPICFTLVEMEEVDLNEISSIFDFSQESLMYRWNKENIVAAAVRLNRAPIIEQMAVNPSIHQDQKSVVEIFRYAREQDNPRLMALMMQNMPFERNGTKINWQSLTMFFGMQAAASLSPQTVAIDAKKESVSPKAAGQQ